jgi:hypothetical protein
MIGTARGRQGALTNTDALAATVNPTAGIQDIAYIFHAHNPIAYIAGPVLEPDKEV